MKRTIYLDPPSTLECRACGFRTNMWHSFSSHDCDACRRAQGVREVTGKIKIYIDDPDMRRTWEAVQSAKAEVESWPEWKRNWNRGGR
jgi:hypothetical protein